MTKERNMATFKVGDRVRLMAGRTGTVTAVHAEHSRCHVKVWSDLHRRELEYLVPDERLTLADPAPTGPRYVVRAASEMREGEWCAAFAMDIEHSIAPNRAENLNAGGADTLMWGPWGRGSARCAIVDTHRTADAPPPPATVEPPRPSDARICEKWALFQRTESGNFTALAERGAYLSVDGQSVTLAECRAAWSRELRRLAAASAETERLRVVVQCQDGGADDV